jgi:Zn-dependent M28 family amino/carboxypeptidase
VSGLRASVGLGLGLALITIAVTYESSMSSKHDERVLSPLTSAELEIRNRARKLVQVLAGDIGGRDAVRKQNLRKAAEYIEGQLRSSGYSPLRQTYAAATGQSFDNIEAQLRGKEDSETIVVIGAHYDTAGGLPGANDNASGVTATLELARQFADKPQARSIRWLFFVNEEPPYFQTPAMGSYVYAKRCRERKEKIAAMLSLETIGYYSSEPGTQHYPIGFHPGYPDRGDFLGFVANFRSAPLLRRALRSFRSATSLPAAGAAAPASIPGIGWSDHWSFWQFGYPALMLTDTAPYRYPYYHSAEDTPEKVDYERLARAITGVAAVICNLASH